LDWQIVTIYYEKITHLAIQLDSSCKNNWSHLYINDSNQLQKWLDGKILNSNIQREREK
jgi:hypothetical protein